jgi:hypothetical protein
MGFNAIGFGSQSTIGSILGNPDFALPYNPPDPIFRSIRIPSRGIFEENNNGSNDTFMQYFIVLCVVIVAIIAIVAMAKKC